MKLVHEAMRISSPWSDGQQWTEPTEPDERATLFSEMKHK